MRKVTKKIWLHELELALLRRHKLLPVLEEKRHISPFMSTIGNLNHKNLLNNL